MNTKLIPKHLTPANPLVLQNDNTLVVQPVLPIPATNIDWATAANNKIDKIIQEQPHSEVVKHPKRPETEKDAMTIIFDPRKASKTSTTEVIGLSPVDPIGEFVVGNAVLGKPLQWLGKELLYGAAKAGNNWARARIISSNMKVSPYKFNRGYYTIGHDLDPGAFYHYERNILPKTTPKTVTLEPRPIIKNNLMSHVQGEDAVKMFKEYGGVKIPKGSINGKELSTYVLEARIRYGLVGNTNISDQEIAEALYKHVNELGKNTKALNVQGEPQLLFRGDTKSYTKLKDRLTPNELLPGTGTMDNSLGTLFLGDITTPDPSGVGRYLVGYKTTPYGTVASPSATGATSVGLYDEVAFSPQNWVKIGQGSTRRGPIGFTKAPAANSSTGVNDLNAFVVKTGNVRNATDEIAVGNEVLLINGKVGNYKGSKKLTGRQAMADHYDHVLKESKANKQGLLKSDIGAPLRDEHTSHEYFALPNWNKHNAKHILPYDLRIPRNWADPNIYKTIIPVGIGIGITTNK